MSIITITNRLDSIDTVCSHIPTVDTLYTSRVTLVTIATPEHHDEIQGGADGRNVSPERSPTILLMVNEDANRAKNGDEVEDVYTPLIDKANVTLSEQESDLIDDLVEGDEYGTSISADEMELVVVESAIDDENREATTDDLVYVYRHRIADPE